MPCSVCRSMGAPPPESFYPCFQRSLHEHGWQGADWSKLRSPDSTCFSLSGFSLEARRVEARAEMLRASAADGLTQAVQNMSAAHRVHSLKLPAGVVRMLIEGCCATCGRLSLVKIIPPCVSQCGVLPSLLAGSIGRRVDGYRPFFVLRSWG